MVSGKSPRMSVTKDIVPINSRPDRTGSILDKELSPRAFNVYVRGPLHLQDLLRDWSRNFFLATAALCLLRRVCLYQLELPGTDMSMKFELALTVSSVFGLISWMRVNAIFDSLKGRSSAVTRQALDVWSMIVLTYFSCIGFNLAAWFFSFQYRNLSFVLLFFPLALTGAIVHSMQRYKRHP
jgi:hypothetical protein